MYWIRNIKIIVFFFFYPEIKRPVKKGSIDRPVKKGSIFTEPFFTGRRSKKKIQIYANSSISTANFSFFQDFLNLESIKILRLFKIGANLK